MKRLVLIPVAVCIAALLPGSALAARPLWKANAVYSGHVSGDSGFALRTSRHATLLIDANGEMEFHWQPCSPAFGWVIGLSAANAPANPAPAINIRPNGSFSATRLNQVVGALSPLTIKVSGKFLSRTRGTLTYQVGTCAKRTRPFKLDPGS